VNLRTYLAHPGHSTDDPHRATATPIYQTATFRQREADRFDGFDYARSGNPTRAALEEQLAQLEHAKHAFVFASGLAALSAATSLLKDGDEILADTHLYGGTFRLFSRILPRRGITVRYVDASNSESLAAAITDKTRLIHIETPTNPTWKIIDIARVAEIARGRGRAAGSHARPLVSVDNTALSPYLQNPIVLGADIVIHSATKYLSGHSDVTAGVVCVSDRELADEIYLIQNGEGAALGPFDTFLLLRGLRTLAVRFDRQQENAQRIAEFLAAHPDVEQVYFPGLPDHPGREIHDRQARGPGAAVSFRTGCPARAVRTAETTRLFDIAVSFGGLSSSISVPAHMSHASVPVHLRELCLPPKDLVRLSVGIEEADDLIADLDRALASSRASRAAAAAVPA
jgi:cystathionine beta-lyase